MADAQAAAIAKFSAVQTIAVDTTLVAKLSPEASSILTLVSDVGTSVLGTDFKTAAQSAIVDLASSLDSTLGDTVDQVIGAVPLLGTVFKFVAGIVTGAIAFAAETEAVQNQRCADWINTARVVPIDTQAATPACIFTPVYKYTSPNDASDAFSSRAPVVYVGPASGELMPALGWGLTACTEGAGYSTSELQQMHAMWVQNSSANGTGVPAPRRAQFRALRKAIAAQLGVAGGFEGGELWPIYLDMLREEFDSGRLSVGLCAFLMTDQGSIQPDGSFISGDCNCFPIANAIGGPAGSLVSAWKNQIHPVTKTDQEARSKMLASVQAATENALTKKPLHFSLPSSPALLISISQGARQGWSPKFSPLLNWSVQAGIMMTAYRKALASPPKLTLPSATLAHLASLAGKFGS